MNQYEKKVEQFRHHYHMKYGVQLDDVTLYFFIRVNEMQKDLKKDIRRIPQVRFRSGWDYFLYGLGKSFKWLYVFLFLTLCIYLCKS